MIRRANSSDIPALIKLLKQVHEVHHKARPDLFREGTTKYSKEELELMVNDNLNPIFVYEDDVVLGYAFCIHKQVLNDSNLTDIKTLYIDDLCVDSASRGKHIGTKLYNYVCDYAKENGYYEVTLNVWADNKAVLKFYESLDLRVQKIGMEKIL